MSASGRGKDIFSTHDAAKICRVTPMTVIRWIKEGKIPAFKTAGGHRRILRQDLERFCRARGIPFMPDEAEARGRVLVVDADAAVRDAIVEAARSCDETLTIEQAGDAFTAGRLFATFHPNMLFFDQRLPGIDALDLVARLTRDPDASSLAVVVLSAAANPDVERSFRSRGAAAVLKKPPPLGAVERLVRSTFQLPDEDAADESGISSLVLVDDDSRWSRQMKRDLEERMPGLHVAVFDTCIDALLAIGADRPDVVVLEAGRHDLDCVEMVRHVHARQGTKPTFIIAIADASNEALRSQVTAAGAGDFLIKPVDAERLSQSFGAFARPRGAVIAPHQIRKKL